MAEVDLLHGQHPVFLLLLLCPSLGEGNGLWEHTLAAHSVQTCRSLVMLCPESKRQQ